MSGANKRRGTAGISFDLLRVDTREGLGIHQFNNDKIRRKAKGQKHFEAVRWVQAETMSLRGPGDTVITGRVIIDQEGPRRWDLDLSTCLHDG